MNEQTLKSASPFDIKIIAVSEVIDFDPELGADVSFNIIDQKEWDASNINEKDLHANKCGCCGQRIKYSAIAKHKPTGNIVAIGKICASKIESLKSYGHLIENASIALSQKILCNHREKEFRALHPEACEALDWAKLGFSRIGSDLLEKLRRFGSFSDKQISFLISLYQRDTANRQSATSTAPTGRASVEGTILSVKEVIIEGKVKKVKYGVVVDIGGGVKVWGKSKGVLYYHAILGLTTNGAITPQKGDRVKFTATFEPSEKDPLFGFFKRPSKWEILSSNNACQAGSNGVE
jgi:hypothetical protein